MKRSIIPGAVCAVIVACAALSCGPDAAETEAQRKADSIAERYTLESLLNVADQNGLESKYGKDAVTYDTIWGAEGYFAMGTILKTEDGSHIEVTWQDENKRQKIVSVTLVSDQDWYADSIYRGQWRSATGVQIGMPIEQLEKINGRAFTFSGFGWDYAGSVLDWQKGHLEGKGIAVQLSEGPAAVELSPEESNQILGDVAVQSDNPLLKPFRPRVWSVSVAKVQ
jgi:hypothetical protein